jgi:hypothetical protein
MTRQRLDGTDGRNTKPAEFPSHEADSPTSPSTPSNRTSQRDAPRLAPTPLEPLPELLDCRRIMEEMGVKRASAEAIMRQVPKVKIRDLDKTFVRRSDVAALIDASTFRSDQLPVR